MDNPVKIAVVVVLYNTAIESCETIRSLMDAREEFDPDIFSLLLYDNSPTAQEWQSSSKLTSTYVNDPSNGGTAAAYNYALDWGKHRGAEWLLLLDQDSRFSPSFLQELRDAAERYNSDGHIAAAVPRVFCRGLPLSPRRRKPYARHAPIEDFPSSVLDFAVTGISSGTMVKTSFMELLGGFERLFWLDFLDHWMFNRIYAHGKAVLVVNARIDHDLSLSDFSENVCEERYINILAAEELYFQRFGSRNDRLLYPAWLVARAVKHLIVRRNARFCRLTMRHACRQLIRLASRGVVEDWQ